MKKIIVLFALLLGSIISIAQPVTQRGTTSVTVQDARLFAQYNFRPPVFPDTTSANTQIGLDSCGALIYSRDINAYYYRACSPKRWVRVSPGGSASDSAYFSYRPLTDTTFLLCRVGGTRCDTIKVNGKGVSTAWLIGGNVSPIPPYIGTIDTKELDIITNNVVRMRVAGNGINRSSAARNKFLTMDTTTRYLYYTDGGGGGDTIPSLQDVLTTGNTYNNGSFTTILSESTDAGDGYNVFNTTFDSKDIRAKLNISNYVNEPYFEFGVFENGASESDNVIIKPSEITFDKVNYVPLHLKVPDNAAQNESSVYFPIADQTNVINTDTLATLRDVRNTNPTLQQVLTSSNTANTSINIEDASINAYNNTVTNIAALDGVNGNIVLKTGNASATIDASNITTSDKNISLPNSSNTLAVSVNGNYADVNGNISISAGGGGIAHGTATGTDTYAVTISGVASYLDGDAYIVRFINGNTTGCTLNINGIGAVPLYRNNDGALIGGDITSNGDMLCVYDTSIPSFRVIGISPNSLLAYVTNAESTTMTKGQVVYAFGGVGDRMTVKLANNVGDATSAQTVGVVLSTSIGANQKGLIIVQGLLDNLSILPTSTYADGDALYLGSTAGSITNIKPSAPLHLVYLGNITTASNGSAGRWYVRIQNGYELQELHNVAIASPTNNQILVYSDTQQLWKNRSIYSVVDTVNTIATKTNVAAKVNISDTATMLTPYIRLAGTGLTKSSQTLSNNLSTGVSGGQSVVGGTAASNSLTLSSTSNATKGKILFGTSAYDEVNNRLGIGTASPSFALDVNGTARISTSDNSYNQQFYIQNTNTGTTALTGLLLRNSAGIDVGQFTYIPPNYIVSAQANQVSFGSVGQTKLSFGANTSANGAAAQDIIFSTLGTNSTYQMQIKGNGNVQINTNTDAGYRLDVNGTARAVTSLQTPTLLGNTTSGGTLTLQSTSNATKGKILFGTSAYDEVNNRIGIGTTSPSEKFEITGTDYAFLKTSVTNTTGNNETGFNFFTYDGTSVSQNGGVTSTNSTFNYQAYGANSTTIFSTKSGGLGLMSRNAAAGNIRFYTGGDGTGNERMRIFNGGNVAIGTATDAGYKLDVNGTARATQFILSALNTAPATATSTGITGEIRIVNGAIYVCVATNTWQRALLTTF